MWGRTRSASRGNERFAARRRERRRKMGIGLGVLGVMLVGAGIYGTHVIGRIKTVTVSGADPSLSQLIEPLLAGSYAGLIPRNSTLFYPESEIRKEIMASSPDVAAVSFARDGLSGLVVSVISRVPVAVWCGETPPRASSTPSGCFMFDGNGVLYKPVEHDEESINTFHLYAPLHAPAAVGRTLPRAETFPRAFDFARQLAQFGSPVVDVIYRDSEVDDILKSGTRVTYVLGEEQMAFTNVVSARDQLNFADGSLDYVDLRFDGKLYVRRHSSATTTPDRVEE